MTARTLLAALALCASSSLASAWDCYGHRLIATLALEITTASPNAPAWLKEPAILAQIADQACTPDRWRSTKMGQITHLNNPDHYLDLEDLNAYGLTLQTVPPLRNEFIKAMILAKDKAGNAFEGRPPRPGDFAKTDEWPGFLPHAILENYGKVVASLKTVMVLEQLNDPSRADQLAMARASVLYNMGILAHFVGDTAQPLHTTKHHHGWKGDNPNGYTTEYSIHAYIDGGVIKTQRITVDGVRPRTKTDVQVSPQDPWNETLQYIQRSHDQVEPLYQIYKRKGFLEAEGKQFIEDRLADAAGTLGAIYKAALDAAAPTEADVKDFVKYDGWDRRSKPEKPDSPTK